MAKKKTIVIIDDTKDILDAMREILTMEGYVVFIAESEDDLHILLKNKKVKPNIFLLDVLLSGQDGRTVSQRLKADPKTDSIPIIMMSAHPDVYKTIIEAGADDFIPKPFNIEDLLNIIEKYI